LRVLEELGIELLWFDSLGAKSASIAITTSEGIVVIDPGAAEMQPSYPLPADEKRRLRREAIRRIMEFARRARAIIVTHYHYDHHTLPGDEDAGSCRDVYLGKRLLVKDPNKYINESQWHRARKFLELVLALAGRSLREFEEEPRQSEFPDPVNELRHALSKSFGDYDRRRRELLEKGRRWFEKLSRMWSESSWIRERIELGDGTVIEWCDGKTLELGDTRIRIFEPWFHGVEYDRTGWVCPIVIEKSGTKVFYTSDLMGPIIEDYAYRIADERPRIVIADGPPTYLFPYMFNRINLSRAIENMIYIVETASPELVVYDHHLLREKRWRERIEPLTRIAKAKGVRLVTAAEYMGMEPLIDRVTKGWSS